MSRTRLPVIALYASGLVQGLAVVAFPASATVLKTTYGLTDTGYGSLFLPQMVFTIIGSILGGALAGRVGLRRLLLAAGALAALSQIALALVPVIDAEHTLALLLVGTALMGTGFGLSAAPLNTLPGLLFPARSEQALVGLHTILGTGFAVGPLLASLFVSLEAWALFPTSVSVGALVVVGAVWRSQMPTSDGGDAVSTQTPEPPLFWLGLLALIAVIYAFAEGTFSNWASVFLHDARNVPEETAAIAISGFWFGLAGGRLAVSAIVARVSSVLVWLALPLLMAGIFFLLPLASGAASGIALFIAAGLATSAFFPLTVAIANEHYPTRAAAVSSILTAALMVGVGSGSFALGALRASMSFDALYRVSMGYPLAAFLLAGVVAMGLRANDNEFVEVKEGTG